MGGESDFNNLIFEKKLSGLKDSQESINACCIWCLDNRQHHKKIVQTWLNVLKRVKVEQRLTLFYLANDVIQYSKRKSYEFVESWGTALQKATTMVRDERVKHKILRIFKIWEQRGVYGEEFITDLSGLISASPSAAKKGDELNEFQSNHIINKIRSCTKLETDTDAKLTKFKKHNPKMLDGEALVSSLKDRAHVDDVEKEMDDYIKHMEEYVQALKLEIKARNNLINLLLTSEAQLEKDRKDVKVVAIAYKSFATRVKGLRKKLDEKKVSLCSPIPSPDINAPSPSPDSDIDLGGENVAASSYSAYSNLGFYNPIGGGGGGGETTQTAQSVGGGVSNSFMNNNNNGFSSFIGSNLPFNMQNLDHSQLFANTDSSGGYSNNIFGQQPPPPPAPVPPVTTTNSSYQYNNNNQMPLVPPPLPPFTNNQSNYTEYNPNYGLIDAITAAAATTTTTSYNPTPTNDQTYHPSTFDAYTPTNSAYNNTQNDSFDYATYTNSASNDEYNPEEEVETWENEWVDQPPSQDTPASPPPLEKESFLEPIEYHEHGQNLGGALDVDHRVLLGNNLLDKKKDVDHRNLISLTGSPKETNDVVVSENTEWPESDQDYRMNQQQQQQDKDYRLSFDKTTAAATTATTTTTQSPRKLQDNNESIDMELSDDEQQNEQQQQQQQEQQLNNSKCRGGLLLPPPPPSFLDDLEANHFLDNFDQDFGQVGIIGNNDWMDKYHQQGPPPPPPSSSLSLSSSSSPPPPPLPPSATSYFHQQQQQQLPQQQQQQQRGPMIRPPRGHHHHQHYPHHHHHQQQQQHRPPPPPHSRGDYRGGRSFRGGNNKFRGNGGGGGGGGNGWPPPAPPLGNKTWIRNRTMIRGGPPRGFGPPRGNGGGGGFRGGSY